MDAPKCRVCGEKHWASENHIWPKGSEIHETTIRDHEGSKGRKLGDEEIEELKARIRELEEELKARPKVSEKRRAWMREYMRKRRAKP